MILQVSFDTISLVRQALIGEVLDMGANKLDKPLQCSNCGEEYLIKRFRSQLPRIVEYCLLVKLKKEMEILNKVEKMYTLFPESRERLVPKWALGGKKSPSVDEIRLWTHGDKVLESFLLSKDFDLEARRQSVEKMIEKAGDLSPIPCPNCGVGVVVFKEGRLDDFMPKL